MWLCMCDVLRVAAATDPVIVGPNKCPPAEPGAEGVAREATRAVHPVHPVFLSNKDALTADDPPQMT